MPTLKVNPKKSSGQDKYQSHKRRSKKSLKIKLGGASQPPPNTREYKEYLLTLIFPPSDQSLSAIFWLFNYLDFKDQSDYEILCGFIDKLFSEYEDFKREINSQNNLRQFYTFLEPDVDEGSQQRTLGFVNLLIGLIKKFKTTLYLTGVSFPTIQPVPKDNLGNLDEQFGQWIENFFLIFEKIRYHTLPYKVWEKFHFLTITNFPYIKEKLYNELNQWLLQDQAQHICIRDKNGNSYQFTQNSEGYYNIPPNRKDTRTTNCHSSSCIISLTNEEQPNMPYVLEATKMLGVFFKLSDQWDYQPDKDISRNDNYFINPDFPQVIFIPDPDNLQGTGNYYIRARCTATAN